MKQDSEFLPNHMYKMMIITYKYIFIIHTILYNTSEEKNDQTNKQDLGRF